MCSLVVDPLTGAQHPDLFAAWDPSKDAQWFLGWGKGQQQPQGQHRWRWPHQGVRHKPCPSCPLSTETQAQLQAGNVAAAAAVSLLGRRHPLCPGVPFHLLCSTMGLFKLLSDRCIFMPEVCQEPEHPVPSCFTP